LTTIAFVPGFLVDDYFFFPFHSMEFFLLVQTVAVALGLLAVQRQAKSLILVPLFNKFLRLKFDAFNKHRFKNRVRGSRLARFFYAKDETW
jgi:hypothetical protein